MKTDSKMMARFIYFGGTVGAVCALAFWAGVLIGRAGREPSLFPLYIDLAKGGLIVVCIAAIGACLGIDFYDRVLCDLAPKPGESKYAEPQETTDEMCDRLRIPRCDPRALAHVETIMKPITARPWNDPGL